MRFENVCWATYTINLHLKVKDSRFASWWWSSVCKFCESQTENLFEGTNVGLSGGARLPLTDQGQLQDAKMCRWLICCKLRFIEVFRRITWPSRHKGASSQCCVLEDYRWNRRSVRCWCQWRSWQNRTMHLILSQNSSLSGIKTTCWGIPVLGY